MSTYMVVVVVKRGRAKNIRVELTSAPGAGTRVSVTVPADMAA
ncbi:hypothetical protein [Mycobacteroides abscessus]|nr:hypothetical protein [Mycobacteroides abscessus]